MEKDEYTVATIDNNLQSILSSFQDEPSLYGFDYPPFDSTFQSPITSPSSFSHRLPSPSPSFQTTIQFVSTPHSHPTSLSQNHFSPPPRFPTYAQSVSHPAQPRCASPSPPSPPTCFRCFRYSLCRATALPVCHLLTLV